MRGDRFPIYEQSRNPAPHRTGEDNVKSRDTTLYHGWRFMNSCEHHYELDYLWTVVNNACSCIYFLRGWEAWRRDGNGLDISTPIVTYRVVRFSHTIHSPCCISTHPYLLSTLPYIYWTPCVYLRLLACFNVIIQCALISHGIWWYIKPTTL